MNSEKKEQSLEKNITESPSQTQSISNTNTNTKITEETKKLLENILKRHIEKKLTRLEIRAKEGEHTLKITGRKFEEFTNNLISLQNNVIETLKELEKSKKKTESKKIKVQAKDRNSKSLAANKRLKINIVNDYLTNKTERPKNKNKTKPNINLNNFKTEEVKKDHHTNRINKNKNLSKIKVKQLNIEKIDNISSPSRPEDDKAKTMVNFGSEKKPEPKKLHNSIITNKSRSIKKNLKGKQSDLHKAFSEVASTRSIKSSMIIKSEKTEQKSITHLKDKIENKKDVKKKPLIKKNKDKDKDKIKKIKKEDKSIKKEEKKEDKKEDDIKYNNDKKEEIKGEKNENCEKTVVLETKKDKDEKKEEDDKIEKLIKLEDKKEEILTTDLEKDINKEETNEEKKEENKEEKIEHENVEKKEEKIEQENVEKKEEKIEQKIEQKLDEKIEKENIQKIEQENVEKKEEKTEEKNEENKKEEIIEEKEIKNDTNQEIIQTDDPNKKDENITEIQNKINEQPQIINQLTTKEKENQEEKIPEKESQNKEVIIPVKKEETQSPQSESVASNEQNDVQKEEKKEQNKELEEENKNNIINQEKPKEEPKKEENNNNNEVIKQITGNENNDVLIENFKKESEADKLADDELIKHYQSQYIDINLNQSLNQSMSFSQSFLQSKSMLGEKPQETVPRDPNVPLTLDEIIKRYKNDFIYVFDFLDFKEKIQFSGIHRGFKNERIYLFNTKREEALASLELKERETLEDRITQFKLKYSKKEYLKPFDTFIINKSSAKSILLLDKEIYSKLFKQKVLDIKYSDMYILYRILFVFMGEPQIAEIPEDEVFWIKCTDYLNVKGKDKIGSFILEKSKNFDFSHKSIYLLNRLLVGIKPKINPATFSKISGTSGLLFFVVKDALEFSGVLISKKTPINRIYDNLMYYKSIIDPLANYIDYLSNIKVTK